MSALASTAAVDVAAVAVRANDLIGEGPAWDERGQCLLWVDQERGLVHEARADG